MTLKRVRSTPDIFFEIPIMSLLALKTCSHKDKKKLVVNKYFQPLTIKDEQRMSNTQNLLRSFG